MTLDRAATRFPGLVTLSAGIVVGACLASGGATPAGARDASFVLNLSQGRVATKHRTLRAGQNDRVELIVWSDRDVRLHLHGYDIEAEARPDRPARLVFQAVHAGRFPLEAHGQAPRARGRILLYIEILPK